MAQAKITALKRAWHGALTEEYLDREFSPQGLAPCQEFEDGQVFVVEGMPGPQKPRSFPCEWAWADLQRALTMILFGGEAPWIDRPGSIVTCCTDGLRPVSFLIERLDD